MKLVLIGPVYPFRGGIAHYTTVLRHELAARGHEVLLISFSRQYPRWLFPGRTDRDPSADILPAPGARYILDPLDPLTWLRAAREIRAFRAEHLVLQWWQAYWAPVWIVLALSQSLRGGRVTMICHNVLPHERHWWDSLVTRVVLGRATHVIVQSAAEREDLRKMLLHKAAEIVPHPLYDMLAGEPVSPEEARRRLGLSEGPVLLFFGFVREYKGLSYLIRALPDVLRSFPNTKLVVAGEFWNNRREYEEQIAALGLTGSVLLV
jgi:D-inositol-3-phosphate glycosyltransferase